MVGGRGGGGGVGSHSHITIESFFFFSAYKGLELKSASHEVGTHDCFAFTAKGVQEGREQQVIEFL